MAAQRVLRDEIVDGEVKRFVGPLRSIMVFDKKEPIRDGIGGVIYPTEKWRQFLIRLYDFEDVDPIFNKYRFCSYVPLEESGCGKWHWLLPIGSPSKLGTQP